VFEDNSAPGGFAGAIFTDAGGNVNVYRGRFFRNTASDGGAISIGGGGAATLEECVFIENEASGGGGAVEVSGTSSVSVSKSELVGNTAVWGGGGLRCGGGGTCTIDSSFFTSNHTSDGAGGGGVQVGTSATLSASATILSSVFAGNSASLGGGGLEANQGTTDAAVVNCTFYGNTAEGSHAAINNNVNAALSVTNTIAWGNVGSGDQIAQTTETTMTYTDLQGSWAAGEDGNIDAGPEFTSLLTGYWSGAEFDDALLMTELSLGSGSLAEGALVGSFVKPDTADGRYYRIVYNTTSTISVWGDLVTTMGVGGGIFYEVMALSLSASSPCIDAANGTVAPATDILGNSRMDDSDVDDTGGGSPTYVDMGAYERQP